MRFSAKDVPILSKTMLRKPKGCLPLLPHPYSLVGPLTLKCKRRVYLKGKFFEKDKIIGKFYGDSCITVFFMTTCQLFDGCYRFFVRCLNPFFFLVKESQSCVLFIESLMLMQITARFSSVNHCVFTYRHLSFCQGSQCFCTTLLRVSL